MSFPATPAEDAYIRAHVASTGMMLTHYIREAVLARIEAEQADISNPSQSQCKSLKKLPVSTAISVPQREVAENEAEIPEQDQLDLEMSRTRASACACAPEELRTKNLDPTGVSSSLRSSQASPPVNAAHEDSNDDDVPWSTPQPLKINFKLSTGEVVTNTWLFANGCRIPGPDVIRLLESSSYKPLRKAMLHCFARSLRDTYKLRWCSAYNRRQNAWKDTSRSNNALLRAAEYLAREYAGRGMTSNQFIDACDEMRPKTVRFVPVDMLAGAIGARVADWIPPEQRTRDKPWDSHVDGSGTQWVTPIGEAPVVVLRTAADRERFLRASKVR